MKKNVVMAVTFASCIKASAFFALAISSNALRNWRGTCRSAPDQSLPTVYWHCHTKYAYPKMHPLKFPAPLSVKIASETRYGEV